MVLSKTSPAWQKVLTEEGKRSFKNISVSMMITRLKSKVKADPGVMSEAIDEMITFFTKFESTMQADIEIITNN